MSNIYHTEPPTQGKVLIKTSYGDIDVELWPREAPLACRNFVQLALEGYYDTTLVHRVIKGFMVQMGDATGTGDGGSSIYGDRPFKDEVHGRIKFNHRGQVAMASDRPNNNLSQFFITLDKCDWLNGKHTIFGKVTGNTIYNVLRIGEAEVSGQDRPAEPIRVLGVEVLWNPFDDVVPRAVAKAVQPVEEAPKRKESKAVAVKDRKLLSFAQDESEDDAVEQVQVRFRSAHEARAQITGRTVVPAVAVAPAAPPAAPEDPQSRISKHSRPSSSSTAATMTVDAEGEDIGVNSEAILDQLERAQRDKGAAQRAAEFQEARAALLKTRRAVNVMTGQAADVRRDEVAKTDLLTPLEQRRQMYKKRKKEHGDRSEETYLKLQCFTEALRQKKSQAPAAAAQSEAYHGQVMFDDQDDRDGGDQADWFQGKLRFAKHQDDGYRYKDTRADPEDARRSAV